MRTHFFRKMTLPTASRPHRPAALPRGLSIASDPRSEIGRILRGPHLQAKLAIGAPNDIFEQEADRVAEQVTRMPDANANLESSLSSEALTLQRREPGNGPAGIETAPAIVQNVLSSPGQPLDAATRSFFEPRFGHDFRKVRIHATAEAGRSAAVVNAHAYTVGNHLVFGSGRYETATLAGKRLLAHELTHVMQQQGAAGTLQRSPVFLDNSCDKQRVKDKITAAVDQSLGLVRQAIAVLAEPERVAGPLKRFFSIEPNDRIALFLIKESLGKLEGKLAGAVNTYCQTPADYRRKNDKSPPRGYADVGDNRRPRPDSPITFNRNIFRLTGTTTHRQVVNTVLHEYAHLAGIGHAEEVQGSPIGDENSTKVRGLNTAQAINSAETIMRFVRAVTSEPLISLKRREPLAGDGPKQLGGNLHTETGMGAGPTLNRRKNEAASTEASLQSRVNFIVAQLDSLKERSAWNGIDRHYRDLESMGDEAFDLLSASRPTAEVANVHDLGAQAAKVLGDVQGFWSRRQRQMKVLSSDVGHIDDATLKNVVEDLSSVEGKFGAVRIAPRSEPRSEKKRERLRGPELVQVQGPAEFDPLFRRSVEFAAAKVASTGYFEGLIPLGGYRLGDQEFTVIAGTKTTDAKVLTVLWGE